MHYKLPILFKEKIQDLKKEKHIINVKECVFSKDKLNIKHTVYYKNDTGDNNMEITIRKESDDELIFVINFEVTNDINIDIEEKRQEKIIKKIIKNTLDKLITYKTYHITMNSVVADTAENRIEKKFNKVNMIYNYTINFDNFKTKFYNYILDLKLKIIFNKGIESLSKEDQKKAIELNEIILLDLIKENSLSKTTQNLSEYIYLIELNKKN